MRRRLGSLRTLASETMMPRSRSTASGAIVSRPAISRMIDKAASTVSAFELGRSSL
jgi:hypothetical protein